MHDTAMDNGGRFFSTYVAPLGAVTVVDIGAQDVNGSLRRVAPPRARYVGVDFVQGRGVDVVLDDPYVLPFDDASVDVVVSSSCFEHSEMFWILYLEIMRVLKDDGLFYLNAPSNGPYHRYPVDCWRFYPDSGDALVAWGRRNGLDSIVLESFTSDQVTESWNDHVCVFLKDRAHESRHPNRITDTFTDFYNGRVRGRPAAIESLNPQVAPQDQRFAGWRWHKRLSLLGRVKRAG
jgi:SAM-dependent methyltransferase